MSLCTFSSNGYTHQILVGWGLSYCSEARPWLDDNGVEVGFGQCPHCVDEDGLPEIVATILYAPASPHRWGAA